MAGQGAMAFWFGEEAWRSTAKAELAGWAHGLRVLEAEAGARATGAMAEMEDDRRRGL